MWGWITKLLEWLGTVWAAPATTIAEQKGRVVERAKEKEIESEQIRTADIARAGVRDDADSVRDDPFNLDK